MGSNSMSKFDRNNRYYAKHRERILASNKAKYWADSQAARDYAAEWKSRHPMQAAYATFKASVKRIDAEFNLSFEEFSDLWGPDVDRRGRTLDCLCMYRYGDAGHYEVGNCYIATLGEHAAGARV